MTTIIDHAIAIPTKQRNVWEQISDISKNHIWQAECEQVAFLTTMHTGKGTRWRVTMANGKSYIVEITAWYEGLGYEYIIIDGMPFTKGKGRIRLQDAPEGTIVQWAFSYEVTGFLSNLRNSLGTKRSVDNNIVNSLRNLYSYIKDLKSDESFSATDSKALLKDAPDVEARLQYQPRHPSAFASQSDSEPSEPVQPAAGLIPELSIIEPPILDGDTKPNPAVATPPPLESPVAEPSFVKDLPYQRPTSEPAPASLWQDAPPQPAEPQVQQETAKPVEPAIPVETSVADKRRQSTDMPPLPLDDQIDTGRVSVFDLFGLPKPSETERVRTINPETPSPLARSEDKEIVPDVFPHEVRRRGLRSMLRERIAKTRIPSK